MQPIPQCIECQRLVGIELKELHIASGSLLDLRDTPTLSADVLIAVGGLADKPALLHSSCQAFSDIE